MNSFRVLMIIVIVAAFASFAACGKDKGKAEEKGAGGESSKSMKAMAAPKTGGSPKVGDSCKGLSPTDGKMACQGNMKIFCSSYSKYKWKSLGECKAPQKCVLGANGKSVSCK